MFSRSEEVDGATSRAGRPAGQILRGHLHHQRDQASAPANGNASQGLNGVAVGALHGAHGVELEGVVMKGQRGQHDRDLVLVPKGSLEVVELVEDPLAVRTLEVQVDLPLHHPALANGEPTDSLNSNTLRSFLFHTKTLPRTQDAQAQTVEKGIDSNDSQKSALES